MKVTTTHGAPDMTNEERAREAAEQIGFVLDEDAAEAIPIILAALDAATAPLVAERERLRALLAPLARRADDFDDLPTSANPEGFFISGGVSGKPGITVADARAARSALAEKEPG